MTVLKSITIIISCLVIVTCADVKTFRGTEESNGGLAKTNTERNRVEQSGIDWRNVAHFKSIDFVDQQFLLALDSRTGKLILTQDGGYNWRNKATATSSFYALDFLNENLGWAVDSTGLFWQSKNGGLDWKSISDFRKVKNDPNFIDARQVQFSTETSGLLLETFKVFETSDGGVSWYQPVKVKGQPWKLLEGDKGEPWILSTNGGATVWAYRRSGGEQKWTETVLIDGCDPRSVFFTNSSNGWIACGNERVWQTTDAGRTWAPVKDLPGNFYVRDIFRLSETVGWLAGYTCTNNEYCLPMNGKATLLETRDAGSTWTSHISEADAFYSYVRFFDLENGWLVSRDRIYKTMDGGVNWKLALDQTSPDRSNP